MKLFRNFLLLLIYLVAPVVSGQVSFPNGVPDISVEDLSVKALTIHPAIKGCIIFAISAHMGRALKSQTLIAGSIVVAGFE